MLEELTYALLLQPSQSCQRPSRHRLPNDICLTVAVDVTARSEELNGCFDETSQVQGEKHYRKDDYGGRKKTPGDNEGKQ